MERVKRLPSLHSGYLRCTSVRTFTDREFEPLPPQIKKRAHLKMDSFKNGAGEEIRTLDINLGKVALYH